MPGPERDGAINNSTAAQPGKGRPEAMMPRPEFLSEDAAGFENPGLAAEQSPSPGAQQPS